MRDKETGNRGEQYAADLLTGQGFDIVARNWHSRYGEIDIIATHGEYICFVEVKARRSGGMVTPEASVTPSKQKKIIATALLYLQEHPCDLQPRFDVCCIETGSRGQILNHTYLAGAFDGEAYEKNY